jgi:hypothetical protein
MGDNGRAMRVSDREREATIRVLRDSRAEGRLSTETFEERVEAALAARHATDLRQLTADVSRVTRVRAWLAHAARSDPAAPALGEACLRLSDVGDRPFLVGRSREADLIVGADTVSRRHAQLVRKGDAVVLTDLGSTNGTWLGGRQVGQVEVVRGDVLRLGDLPLRLL